MRESCYREGEILFKVAKLADQIQKGEVDVPGFTDFIKRKTNELKEAINEAKPYFRETEIARVESGLSEIPRDILAGTEEIIRTVQLPMTIAGLKCIEERRK